MAMLKFDLRVKLDRVTSGAKIAVSAFNVIVIARKDIVIINLYDTTTKYDKWRIVCAIV